MSRQTYIKPLFLYLLVFISGISWASETQYTGPNRDENGQIVPVPKGEHCVEPTSVMRSDHMKFLLHKRDETMYDGIRTKKHSLVECIDCHATPDKDGKIARITDEKHFCSSCHVSAAVKLDCFECHADRPVESFSELPESPIHQSIFPAAHGVKPYSATKPDQTKTEGLVQ